MVAEFRARMVGRVAILAESIQQSIDGYRPEIDDQDELGLDRLGANQAIEWVQTRYPHLAVTKHSSERPDLVAHVLALQQDFAAKGGVQPWEGQYPVVLAIEFEDDQQATDFKLRWI